MNFFNRSQTLSLDRLREVLIRLEDTIIFALIERAQFACNAKTYVPCCPDFAMMELDTSFLDYFLLETEKVHASLPYQAKVRRYTSPDEYPFSDPSQLPKPVLPPLDFPYILKTNTVHPGVFVVAFPSSDCFPGQINVNKQIKQIYIERIVPQLCDDRDDLNYGSSATRDVECLQALSKRIHYGKFIAEAKYCADPATYDRLAKAGDRAGILEKLTNTAVEQKLLQRLRKKAEIYGQDLDTPQFSGDGADPKRKIDRNLVAALYQEFVIPLTKEVEVEYLLMRPSR
ncbi:chorismate mutase aro7 [Sorochytrium milnesiophthora]